MAFVGGVDSSSDGRLDKARARLLPGWLIVIKALLLDVVNHHVVVQEDDLGPWLLTGAASELSLMLAGSPMLTRAGLVPIRVREVRLVPEYLFSLVLP